jgi:hypothetical protein
MTAVNHVTLHCDHFDVTRPVVHGAGYCPQRKTAAAS